MTAAGRNYTGHCAVRRRTADHLRKPEHMISAGVALPAPARGRERAVSPDSTPAIAAGADARPPGGNLGRVNSHAVPSATRYDIGERAVRTDHDDRESTVTCTSRAVALATYSDRGNTHCRVAGQRNPPPKPALAGVLFSFGLRAGLASGVEVRKDSGDTHTVLALGRAGPKGRADQTLWPQSRYGVRRSDARPRHTHSRDNALHGIAEPRPVLIAHTRSPSRNGADPVSRPRSSGFGFLTPLVRRRLAPKHGRGALAHDGNSTARGGNVVSG